MSLTSGVLVITKTNLNTTHGPFCSPWRQHNYVEQDTH